MELRSLVGVTCTGKWISASALESIAEAPPGLADARNIPSMTRLSPTPRRRLLIEISADRDVGCDEALDTDGGADS